MAVATTIFIQTWCRNQEYSIHTLKITKNIDTFPSLYMYQVLHNVKNHKYFFNMECYQQLFYSSQTPLIDSLIGDSIDPNILSNPTENIIFYDDCFVNNVLDSSFSFPSDSFTSPPNQDPSQFGNDINSNPQEYLIEGGSLSSRITEKPKRDRSKTLVSERKRRSRMKRDLYELRSLVPNITKMDKASIIGDAVVYVKSLQNEAKKLQDEISVLESSSRKNKVVQLKQVQLYNSQCEGKVVNLMVHEVEGDKFYVMIECKKGNGVVAALYSAIESLDCLHVENSNLSVASGSILMKLSIHVRENKEMMDAPSLRLWFMGALLKEGFSLQI